MSSAEKTSEPKKIGAPSTLRLPAGMAFTGTAIVFSSLYLAAGAPTAE